MPPRKRSLEAQEDEAPVQAAVESPLKRIRGMWQFANLCQWIYTFGKAAKIDESIDIEEIETACLDPNSTLLQDIALALLKIISSHRGLTHDIFDSQARKQFLEKTERPNPFGTEEEPTKFQDFDNITKICVLQQMTQWTMIHPERLREKMEEQKDIEQTSWRIEPYGWDSDDRTYFVLDDNRVYRLTDAPPEPPPKSKKKTKAFRSGRRSSKRRRVEVVEEDEVDNDPEDDNITSHPPEEGLGGMSWECLAVSLEEVRTLLEGFRKTRDQNEKVLRRQLEDHLLPILEKQEESRKRRAQQRERELLNLAKMANAKRSSRIANKVEQHKQEEKERDELQQRQVAEEAQRKEEQAQLKRERERDFRLASREKRLKEREARRHRHEEELAQLSEDSRRLDDGSGRISERRLQAEIEKNRQALEDLDDEDDDWVFDCICGLHGQIDDGTHSVACERCNVWQHSKCLGISEAEAERPEFHLICGACRRREEVARERQKPTIKLKLNRSSLNSQQSPAAKHQSKAQGDNVSNKGDKLSTSTFAASHPSQGQSQNIANGATEINASRLAAQGSTAAFSGPIGSTSRLEAPPERPAVSPLSHNHQQSGLSGSKAPDGAQPSPNVPNLERLTTAAHANQSPPPNKDLGASPTMILPTSVVRTPSFSFGQLQGSESVTESALSTPAINRDIYRAAHSENGNLPAQAGFSPIKHSPKSSFTSVHGDTTGATPTRIPPGITLSPTVHEPILTPPTKHSEPPRYQDSQGSAM